MTWILSRLRSSPDYDHPLFCPPVSRLGGRMRVVSIAPGRLRKALTSGDRAGDGSADESEPRACFPTLRASERRPLALTCAGAKIRGSASNCLGKRPFRQEFWGV